MSLSKETISDFIDAAVEDQPKAREMLAAHPELHDARWILGETALHFCAIEYFTDAVRFLAEEGFDVNCRDELNDTPLLSAALLGSLDIAKILIEFGADVNASSTTTDSVVENAIGYGNAEMVDLLLSKGASFKLHPDWGLLEFMSDDNENRPAIAAVLRKHGLLEGEK